MYFFNELDVRLNIHWTSYIASRGTVVIGAEIYDDIVCRLLLGEIPPLCIIAPDDFGAIRCVRNLQPLVCLNSNEQGQSIERS
jgi:hypothetical protein